MTVTMEDIAFRDLVRDCAEEPELVASFNRTYGARLQAPITALLDGSWPLRVSPEEELVIGCFIIFVHEQLWERLKRAQAMARGSSSPYVIRDRDNYN